MSDSSEEYPNPWRLIEAPTAREIVGMTKEHYDLCKGNERLASVNMLQVEFDLFDDHPRLHNRFSRLFPREDTDLCYRYSCLPHAIHGTAVASIISDLDHGVTPGANFYFTGVSKSGVFNEPKENPYKSILPVLRRINDSWTNTPLGEGDIVSISVQIGQEEDDGSQLFFPIDAEEEVANEIRKLSEKGLLIFIAAGNSQLNLDEAKYSDSDGYVTSYKTQSKASPAFKVGYTGLSTGSRHWSNYGDVVDFFAPCGAVSSACYTYNADERGTDLIETFSGGFGKSSAATPMVASIAAKAQRMHKSIHSGRPMGRNEMSDFLKSICDEPVFCEDPIERGKWVGGFPNGNALEASFKSRLFDMA